MSDEETVEVTEAIVPDERPAWLPSNFEKPEDLAKSYSHAASKITSQGQELAELRSQMEEIQAAQQSSSQAAQTASVEQLLYDAYESGDGQRIAEANAWLVDQAVAQRLEAQNPAQPNQGPVHEMTAFLAEQIVAQDNQDWPEYRAKVGEVIAANPALRSAIEGETNPRNVAAHLETAYKLAKYDAGASATSQAAAEVAEINRQVKNQAQTMSGGNASTEAESYWDTVKQAKAGIPSFRL